MVFWIHIQSKPRPGNSILIIGPLTHSSRHLERWRDFLLLTQLPALSHPLPFCRTSFSSSLAFSIAIPSPAKVNLVWTGDFDQPNELLGHWDTEFARRFQPSFFHCESCEECTDQTLGGRFSSDAFTKKTSRAYKSLDANTTLPP